VYVVILNGLSEAWKLPALIAPYNCYCLILGGTPPTIRALRVAVETLIISIQIQ
jgi:hypothetical protein